MDSNWPDRSRDVDELVSAYEAMSRTGIIGFFDRYDFQQMLDYYEDEYNVDKALELVEYALEQHGFSEEFYLRKAQLLLSIERPKEALIVCQQAANYAPNEWDVLLLLAEINTKLGQADKARALIDLLREKAQSKADLAELYIMDSFICESNENYRQMYQELRRALYLDPDNEVALERIWVSIEMCQNYRDSIKLHKHILDQHPYKAMAWYNLGHAYASLLDYTQATDAFEYAIAVDENCEFAYREGIHAYKELHDYKHAQQLCQKLIKLVPNDAELYVELADCHFELGAYKNAIRFYEMALEYNPQQDIAYFHIGECYELFDDLPNAIHYYLRALDIDDRKEEYYAALGNAYFFSHAPEKADYFLSKATELAPEKQEYWLDYFSFLINIESYERAKELLDEAGLYCNCPEFLFGSVVLLLIDQQHNQALLLLAKALSVDYEAYKWMFEVYPEAENDPAIWHCIETFGATLDYLDN